MQYSNIAIHVFNAHSIYRVKDTFLVTLVNRDEEVVLSAFLVGSKKGLQGNIYAVYIIHVCVWF